MSKFVKEVTGQELNDLIESGKTVVCDFWASWCGPCRMLAPVIDALAEEFQTKATFVKLNIDDETETALKLGIMSIPDVYVFVDGKVRDHSLGYTPEDELRLFFEENL